MLEVIVTGLCVSFLGAAVNAAMLAGNSSWKVNSVEVELKQDLRQAMERIRNDIQQTGPTSLDASVPVNVQADIVTYPDPDDDPAYDFTSYTLFAFQTVSGVTNGVITWNSSANQFSINGTDLERTIGTNPAVVIAENIQSIQIRRLYTNSNLVEFALVAQKKTLSGLQGRTISSTMNFQVQLMN